MIRKGRFLGWTLVLLTSSLLWAAQTDKHSRHPLAGTVVRSTEYVVHRGAHEIEEFIGDVSYRHGLRETTADWAQFDRDQGLWDARGHVVAKDRREDGSAVETVGELSHYDTVHQDGWLVGKDAGSLISYKYFVSTPSIGGTPVDVERDHGTAHRLEWNDISSDMRLKGAVHMEGEDGELSAEDVTWQRDKSQIVAHGDVHSVRPDGKTWSQDAVHYLQDRHTVFTGRRPVLTRDEPKSSMAIQGNVVVANRNPDRLVADGQVKGWLWFVREEKKKKSKSSKTHG